MGHVQIITKNPAGEIIEENEIVAENFEVGTALLERELKAISGPAYVERVMEAWKSRRQAFGSIRDYTEEFLWVD